MTKQIGISPKLYGAVIGGLLSWIVQAVFKIDAATVHIVTVGEEQFTLASILTGVGIAAGAYLFDAGNVEFASPEDEWTPGEVDPTAGDPLEHPRDVS